MMPRMITAIITAVLLAVSITPSAYADPEIHLAQTEDGQLWVVSDSGARYQITPIPIAGSALSGAVAQAPSDNGLITVPSAPLAAAPGEKPVTLSGPGSMNTPLFGLAGGNYTVRWSGKSNRPNGSCYLGIFLRTASGSMTELLVNAPITASSPSSGETQVYRVPAGGDYYIDANATCPWEMTIAPQ